MCQRNNKARSRNHCFRGKVVSITYFEYVSAAFLIQYTTRMRRGLWSSVACLVVSYFSTLKKKDTKLVFLFSLQLYSDKFVILGRTETDIFISVHGSPCKLPVFLVGFS